MKQVSSRELFAYWNTQRGLQRVPDRADIEPGAIRGVLGDTFILAADADAGHPFRLAGTRVCALFCRELKGEAFSGLWGQDGRAEMQARVGIVADESIGLIASAAARNADRATLQLELLLLPLALRGNAHARIIGALVPNEVPYWLGVSPITSLTLTGFRHLDPELERDPPLFVSGAVASTLATSAPTPSSRTTSKVSFSALPSVMRQQPGLRVFEGGRIG
jgi:hypothetical protein